MTVIVKNCVSGAVAESCAPSAVAGVIIGRDKHLQSCSDQGDDARKMRAVVITRGGGGPEVLEAQEVEDPAPLGDGEVLLQVAAAGVNRARTRGSSAPAPSSRSAPTSHRGGPSATRWSGSAAPPACLLWRT
jgi:hypothetical protein